MEDGTYRLIREKVSVVTIDDMLLNQKSLLTYQEYHSLNKAFIKWICIDLDISKSEIDENAVNEANLELVTSSANDIVNFLKELAIPYLLEFSGRRGFHIWIVFEELQPKETGFHLVNYILSNVALKVAINADRFPKTRGVGKNTKMVGLGVKLPLSQNKVSGKLSFFLDDPNTFNLNQEFWPSRPTDTFLAEQLIILDAYSPLTSGQLDEVLANYLIELASRPYLGQGYLSNIKLTPVSEEALLLDNVLADLHQCEHIDKLLLDYRKGLGGKERSLMVGLLGKLKSPEDHQLGYKLLLEFFSRIKGFRKELTEEKLKLIQYYFPVTCSQLGKCAYCTCNPIVSPVELIQGIKIEQSFELVLPDISIYIFNKIISALKKYAIINDEIPLFPLLKKIENTSFKEIDNAIAEVYKGSFPAQSEFFEFKRNEGDKIRKLYSLDATNNIISTYFLFVLNNIFYTEISENSFGYRLAPSFHSSNIFGNWFINWSIFSKNVNHILNNVEFEDYYVIKVDIRSFYDRIDLQRLRIKLYEEAPTAIKIKLNTLSEAETRRYKSIIDYLIQLSAETTNNGNKGLPQGPAYARYLAELYLLGLDKLIEGEIIKDRKREFYYRFVDDIFVFVEDENKAHVVLKEIDKWININNLELNLSKTEIHNVADYNRSGKFKRFQDDAKYLINKANKNKAILTEAEIQESLSKLENLTNDVKFGLKDNLRFFYFQFSGDPRLNHIKNKLIKFLPYSDTGRGTLYMMFYADLIKLQPDDFWAIASQQERLTGLSLGHYLNTILFNEEPVNTHRQTLAMLIDSLTKRQDLTYADKSLIITIAMKFDIALSEIFLKTCPKLLINSAMETPEIQYTIRDYGFIEEKLRDKDKASFVKELYRIIIQHPLTKAAAQKLAGYSFLRFSEWHQQGGIAELMDSEELIIQYYHVLCFFTLFDDALESSTLISSWENLLQQSKSITLTKNISFDWLTRAVDHSGEDFSKSSYTLLLSNKEGSPLNKYDCPHGFLKQFQNILLVLLFSKEIKLENFSTEDKSYMDTNSLFGKWLLDGNVKLYPVKDNICVKNLALNGLIVLENDSHIFVKSINQIGDLKRFDYLQIDPEYNNNEVEIAKSELLDLYNRSLSFKQFLEKVRTFVQNAATFMDKYQVKYPVYYKNPYAFQEQPLIPYYSEFSQKVSPAGITHANDVAGFWETIQYISAFNNADIHIVADMHNPFNFSIGQLDSRFFPKSELIINSVEDRIDFLGEFLVVLGSSGITSIYDFQYFWTQAAWNTLSKKRRGGSDLSEYLNVHFSDFPTVKEMPYDIFFTVNSRTEIVSDTLLAFFQTIRQSFANFQNEVETIDFDIVDILDEELAILSDFTNERSFTLADLKRVDITFKSQFDPHSRTPQVKLLVNGQSVPDKHILLFERDPIGFYKKNMEELATRTRAQYVFAIENEEELLIYVPELEIAKAFNRIAERKEFLDATLSEPNDYVKVFPKQDHYEAAEKEYDSYDFQGVESKLKDHYANTINIKERVVYWLSLFNDQSIAGSKFGAYLNENQINITKFYRAVLELISIHYSVSDTALAAFEKSLRQFNDENCILFPLKHPDRDRNGLSRMLKKCGFQDRELNFEKNVSDLFNQDCKGRTLVIVADTSISGSQADKSLQYYLKVFKDQAEFEKYQVETNKGKEKYFSFTTLAQTQQFQRNLKQIEKIIFITPLITDAFIKRMEALPVFEGKKIEWVSTDMLSGDSYTLGADHMNMDNKKIIMQLLDDTDLLDKLFRIPDLKMHTEFNRDHSKANILLRIGSLPTKHIRVLSLKPKNGYLSLFDYVENWKN
ncbi:hypothetical protein HQ865_24970 [Mucilaginibacter mali]|uniref:Reverse transcriptase domain-containing protein n=1 Tax=Mucilaginibacter mali TaxID=2740462 RepID=A0A7D4QXS2_9SPHI|nr:RNA-directed DNA polymerase [Mucilaginibacter mali]QKJ32869.1 hypothetical protein HQ865_24970 [Mucilaginibacter mali]